MMPFQVPEPTPAQNRALLMTDSEIRGQFGEIVIANWTWTETSEAYREACAQARKQLVYTEWLRSVPGSDEETYYAVQLMLYDVTAGAGQPINDDGRWYTQ